jgi:outer membrane lipoprotein-sorting protein
MLPGFSFPEHSSRNRQNDIVCLQTNCPENGSLTLTPFSFQEHSMACANLQRTVRLHPLVQGIGFFALLCVVLPLLASAQNNAGNGVTVQDISDHLQAMNRVRQAALLQYESERTYQLQYQGIGGGHFAELVVQLVYQAPDQKHFLVKSEKGSRLLCHKVLWKLVESEEEAAQKTNRLQMTLNLQNYTMQLVGQELLGNIPTYVLDVTPKSPSKFSYRGRVWISTADYAVVRISGEPAKNPSWWVNHASFDSHYAKVGDFWLPEENISTSHVRIGGEARLTIDYGQYHILQAAPLPAEQNSELARTQSIGPAQ